jgi:hypothetical protein
MKGLAKWRALVAEVQFDHRLFRGSSGLSRSAFGDLHHHQTLRPRAGRVDLHDLLGELLKRGVITPGVRHAGKMVGRFGADALGRGGRISQRPQGCLTRLGLARLDLRHGEAERGPTGQGTFRQNLGAGLIGRNRIGRFAFGIRGVSHLQPRDPGELMPRMRLGEAALLRDGCGRGVGLAHILFLLRGQILPAAFRENREQDDRAKHDQPAPVALPKLVQLLFKAGGDVDLGFGAGGIFRLGGCAHAEGGLT